MADNVMRLGLVLSATDKMSRIIDQAVGKSVQKLNAFQKRAAAIGGGMQKTGLGMVAAGTAIAGGMFAITQSVAEGSKELVRTAAKVGMSVEEWQKIGFAAKYSGVDADKFRLSLQKLQKQQFEASIGNKAAEKNFKLMGLSVKDASGHLKPANILFSELSDKFAKAPNGPAKTAMAMKLFGKTGADLIPFLNKGSAGIDELRKQAEKTGNVLSGKNVADLKVYNEHIKESKIQLEGMKIQLAIAVLPILEKFTNKITEIGTAVIGWINENRDLFETIADITAKVGGALIVLGTLNMIVGTIIKSVQIFNLLFAISPIGWIVITVVALIAALAYCWNEFETFRAVVKTAWETVKEFGSILKDYVMDRISGIIEGLGSMGKAIGLLFSGKFKAAFDEAGRGVRALSGYDAKLKAVTRTKALITGITSNYAVALSKEKDADRTSKSGAAMSAISANNGNINSSQNPFNYSPTININGGSADAKAGIMSMFDNQKQSLEQMMTERENRKKRLNYAGL